MTPKQKVTFAICLIPALGLAACQNNDAIQTVTDNTDSVDIVTESTEVTYPTPEIEAVDCEGRELRIAVYDAGVDARIPYSELGSGEQDGEVLNDAIYDRNLKLAEKYNLVIAPRNFSLMSELNSSVSQSVLAGTDDVDIVFCSISECMGLAMKGYAHTMGDIPFLDFDAPWWLSGIMEDSSIGGVNYFAAGYANTRLFEGSGAVYFNKRMIDEFSIENPYGLVDSGEWTFDKFNEICRGITHDVNGDGILGLEDRYGFATNNANWMQFYASCGNRIVTKDESDLPYLSFGDAKSLDMIERIITFMNDQDTTLLAEKYTGYPEQASANTNGANRRTMIPIETFIEDRAVFVADVIASIRQLRNMEADFGVLPPPKYDSSQEDYISYVHPAIASGLFIPITNTETDLMGRILEDMMYMSYELVRPAMFEVVLNEKYTRDSESSKSFDQILNGVRLDLGLCVGLTIDNDVRVMIAENNNAISSVYQKNLNVNNNKLSDAVEAFAD